MIHVCGLWVVRNLTLKYILMGSRVWNPPFEVGFMVKLQVIELGFRTNLNKSLCLVCVWVMTHIRVVWE